MADAGIADLADRMLAPTGLVSVATQRGFARLLNLGSVGVETSSRRFVWIPRGRLSTLQRRFR